MRKVLLATATLLGLFSPPSYAGQNLLPNGDFSLANKLAGWTNTTAQEFDPTRDADGNSDSGSLRPPVSMFVYDGPISACFSVLPGAEYSYGGQATRSLAGFASEVTTRMVCSVYPNTDCRGDGTALDGVVMNLHYGNVYDFAPPQSVSGILPSNAISANCEVTAGYWSDLGDTPAFVYADNLFFNSVAPSAGVTVDGYMSGSWYDPDHSGHGFDIDITDQDNQVVAYWFNYAADGSGRQVWFYAQGTYDPTRNSVTLNAGITDGASFPPMFDSGDVKVTPWGTITFTFTDCNHGTASWHSILPGYGSGSIPIARLTHIKGTACAR